MVNVTERAKEELLRKKVSAKIDDTEVGLRLATAVGGQLVLVADKAKAGDEVVTYKDSTVLLVDREMSALVLGGRTVDCKKTDDGRLELIVRRSKAM
jgi:hypothetical protein